MMQAEESKLEKVGSGLFRPQYDYVKKGGNTKEASNRLWDLMNQYISSDALTI